MLQPTASPSSDRQGRKPLRFWLAVFAGVTLLLLTLLVGAAAVVLGSYFNLLEREQAESSAHLAQRALARLGTVKREAAIEYSTWDEMADFAAAPGAPGAAEWLDTNVLNWHRQRYADQLVVVWGSDREVAFEWSTPPYADAAGELLAAGLLDRLDTERRLGGIVRTGAGLALLGAGVITDTQDLDALKPARGYLLAVRPFDSTVLADLSDVLGKTVAIDARPEPTMTRLDSEGRHDGYTASGNHRDLWVSMTDVFGEPVGYLHVTEPRNALPAIHGSLNTALGVALALVVGLIGLLWLAGRRLLVHPLAAMESALQQMRGRGVPEPLRVRPPTEEWSLFIHEFNATIEALSASEARYRALFDQAADAIFLIERSSGRVLAANPAAEALTGLGRTQLIGAVLFEHLKPEAAQQDFCGTFRAIRPDRSRRMIAARSTDIRVDGTDYVLVAMRDQTEREELARAMRETQHLEGLAVLAGGVAHDFNNLLAVIAGNAGLARAERDPERRRERLQKVEAAAARASDLTRQLLAYAGRGELQRSRVDLARLTAELSELLRTTVGEHIRLQLVLPREPAEVLGDPGQLQQIVLNLITNAAEAFDRPHGEVRVTCETRLLNATQAAEFALPPGCYICLEVRDDGIGMTPDVRQRVFEPFFSTKFTGRGLGLAAVYGVVRGHGGHVAVTHSAPGEGTTIRVLLPQFSSEEAPRALPRLPGSERLAG